MGPNKSDAAPGSSSVEFRAGRGEHIPVLDGLRGVAIALVLVYHFSQAAGVPKESKGWFAHIAGVGWSGVDLFFVLSGFLITGILYDIKESPTYFRSFFARRILRIFPLYYGLLIVVFGIIPLVAPSLAAEAQPVADRQGWLWAYGANFCLAREGPGSLTAGWCRLSHFWSLAVEEHFYLVWPLVVYLLGRRSLLYFCGAVMVVALTLRVALVWAGRSPMAIVVLTPCHMDTLALGAFVALAARGPGGLGPFRRAAPLVALTSAALLTALFIRNRGLEPMQDPLTQTAGYSLVALFCAALLVLTVTAPPGASWGVG
jgi:peptidoglycan/LPS O-acetylase OafA/YrhL